jgi:hypothetical protein
MGKHYRHRGVVFAVGERDVLFNPLVSYESCVSVHNRDCVDQDAART